MDLETEIRLLAQQMLVEQIGKILLDSPEKAVDMKEVDRLYVENKEQARLVLKPHSEAGQITIADLIGWLLVSGMIWAGMWLIAIAVDRGF